MRKKEQIEHEGIVQKISTHSIKINVLTPSSCNGCHARNICSIEQSKDEDILINHLNPSLFSIGEKVKVKLSTILGLKAVLLAYVFPLIVLLISLVVTDQFIENELIAGLTSVFILIPYYSVLYLLKDKLKKGLSFTIEKIT